MCEQLTLPLDFDTMEATTERINNDSTNVCM